MAVYGITRASTWKQESSPQVQADAIKRHAAFLGVGEPIILHEKLGTSGYKTTFAEREQGKWLLANLRGGDILILPKLDRLGRRAYDILRVIETLSERGVRLYVIDFYGGQSLDISTGIGRFIVTIMAGLTQFERDVLCERTSSSLQWRKANGYASGKPPFGFKIVPAAPAVAGGPKPLKYLVPIDPGAVEEIVRRMDAGERPAAIARDFYAKGRTCRGKPWVKYYPLRHHLDTRRIRGAYEAMKRINNAAKRGAAPEAGDASAFSPSPTPSP